MGAPAHSLKIIHKASRRAEFRFRWPSLLRKNFGVLSFADNIYVIIVLLLLLPVTLLDDWLLIPLEMRRGWRRHSLPFRFAWPSDQDLPLNQPTNQPEFVKRSLIGLDVPAYWTHCWACNREILLTWTSAHVNSFAGFPEGLGRVPLRTCASGSCTSSIYWHFLPLYTSCNRYWGRIDCERNCCLMWTYKMPF